METRAQVKATIIDAALQVLRMTFPVAPVRAVPTHSRGLPIRDILQARFRIADRHAAVRALAVFEGLARIPAAQPIRRLEEGVDAIQIRGRRAVARAESSRVGDVL